VTEVGIAGAPGDLKVCVGGNDGEEGKVGVKGHYSL
jgi:hypothetical protein